jgi:hypothetical protein
MASFLKVGPTGLPTTESTVQSSTGAGDAGRVPGLDAGGKLDATFMPTGFGSDTRTITAGETVAGGSVGYLNGTGQILKADANAVAKAATCFVLATISNASSGTVYFGSGIITGLSGLTPGQPYFLSNIATGAVGLYSDFTFTTGDIIQQVGVAISSTELYFEPQTPIVVS